MEKYSQENKKELIKDNITNNEELIKNTINEIFKNEFKNQITNYIKQLNIKDNLNKILMENSNSQNDKQLMERESFKNIQQNNLKKRNLEDYPDMVDEIIIPDNNGNKKSKINFNLEEETLSENEDKFKDNKLENKKKIIKKLIN